MSPTKQEFSKGETVHCLKGKKEKNNILHIQTADSGT